ncbi:MAG: TatD family hydrolase [Clostridia bacterium]|nr:TatD family hydrolase [Clostridia bacterium]
MHSCDYFDVHNHIENYGPYENMHVLLNGGSNEKIGLLMMAMDMPTYLEAAKIENSSDNAAAAFGIHPWRAHLYHDRADEFEKYVSQARIIGEIGLCGKWAPKESEPYQKEVFETLLALSEKYDRPVSVHTVGREAECLEMIKAFGVKNVCIHWFHGDIPMAKKYLDLGCYFSLGPDVGFSDEADELARFLPRERILIETDGADCFAWARKCEKSPWQYEPSAIIDVYYHAAKVRGESLDTLSIYVKENFFAFTRF